MNEPLFFIALLLVVGLAIVGLLVVAGPGETKQQRISRETREAQRRISQIGQEARAAIMEEMLRQEQAQWSRGDVVEGEVVDVRNSPPPPWNKPRPPS